jgi:hypothetical protein
VKEASDADPLTKLRAAFDQKAALIEKDFSAASDRAAAGYARDLQAVIEHMQKTGDEFGVRPAQDELKRFARERTVPAESPPGTPELIVKARGRYAEALAPAEAARTSSLESLKRAYAAQLEQLRKRYEDASAAAEAGRVAQEIARIGATAAEPPGAVPASGPPLNLPAGLLGGLRAAYALNGTGSAVKDLGGKGAQATLSGTSPAEGPGGGAREFAGEIDAINVKELRAGAEWTIVVRARFPLLRDGRRRVLASGGYDRHHVLVDERGVIGVHRDAFVGSGYDVSPLRGWHEIAAVATMGRTYFFVDAKPVGFAKAVCEDPVKSFGNSATGGHPWGGALSAVMVWGRALTDAQLAALRGAPPP